MKEPIRVLHIVPKLAPGGIETLLMNICRHIDRTKINFDFLIHSSEKGVYDDELRALGCRLFYLHRLSARYFFLSYKNDLRAFFLQHKNDYDIIHSHIDTLSAIPLKEASLAGYPIRIAHSHNTSITDRGIKRAIKNFYKKRIPRYATHLFACSNMAGEFCFGNNSFYNITNGIEVKRFLYKNDIRKKYRERLSIDDKTIVFVHTGAFRKQKNHLFLLEVFASILYFLPDSKLVALGDGELRFEIEEKIKSLGLEEACILLGNTADVAEYLSASDVFLLPSLFEGLPIAAIEAQASGLPVFISDTVTPETQLGKNYFRFSLDEGHALWGKKIAKTLQQLTAPEICTAETLNARREPSEKINTFDISETVRQLEHFYLEQGVSLK